MLPSLVAQPLSEAVMYLLGIDFNINSLPVAAVGIGIGIDYGYYVLSRIVEELKGGDESGFDAAIRRMFETTGKTVLFTGVSLTASIIFWVFLPMKFQADMALLLVLLLGFHLMGALMFIPPMVSLFKPKFAIPFHYGTFPVLKGTPQEYQQALGQTTVQVFPLSPGDKQTF